MDYQNIQEQLKKGYSLSFYEPPELKYLQHPIGEAIYTHSLNEKNSDKPKKDIIEVEKRGRGRPRLKSPAKWSDRIKCDVCGKDFIRSRRCAHNKTKIHLAFEKMNKKLRKILLDN